MGEPDTPHAPPTPFPCTAEIAAAIGVPEPRGVGIVGCGRLDTALARAFYEAGLAVGGPAGGGEATAGAGFPRENARAVLIALGRQTVSLAGGRARASLEAAA